MFCDKKIFSGTVHLKKYMEKCVVPLSYANWKIMCNPSMFPIPIVSNSRGVPWTWQRNWRSSTGPLFQYAALQRSSLSVLSLLGGKKLRIVGKQECVNFNLFPGGPGHLGVGGKSAGMDRRWNRILSHRILSPKKHSEIFKKAGDGGEGCYSVLETLTVMATLW